MIRTIPFSEAFSVRFRSHWVVPSRPSGTESHSGSTLQTSDEAQRCHQIMQFVASSTSSPSDNAHLETRRQRHPFSVKGKPLWELNHEYYKRFWKCFAHKDWVAADQLWARLKALRVPVNETYLTFQLWQQALNNRVPFEQAISVLEKLEKCSTVDPLILAMNQNLLDSFCELRELRVLNVANLIPNFAYIAWTSAAT